MLLKIVEYLMVEFYFVLITLKFDPPYTFRSTPFPVIFQKMLSYFCKVSFAIKMS